MNDIINSFAHKHRCSRFNQQRMIEALVLELSGLNATLNKRKEKEENELNAELEDTPGEPKGIKEIYFAGATVCIAMYNQKEAIKVEEKLKAWQRLKDFGCGFMLDDHCAVKFVGPDARKITSAEEQRSLSDAYKLLFRGGE